MKIINCKTNYQHNPIGISLENLTFTWEVTEARGKQAAHDTLVIATDPAFTQTVFEESREGAGIPVWNIQTKLAPETTYYWKVCVTDDAGDQAESDTGTFEGGIQSFQGKWIKAPFTRDVHPVMRKSFTVKKNELKNGRLYICGFGLYEAYLNGKKVGDQYLTPYCTDYRYWAQYQTYDLTGLLQEGDNTLDVWLGEGWYKGRFGYLNGGQLREYYGDTFCLMAELHLNGEAGRTVIATGADWKCLKSPVVTSGLYDGELYDARRLENLAHPSAREIADAVVMEEAPVPSLTPMVGVPVTKHESLRIRKLITTPAGETVLDFGQEITGWVEFTAQLKRETQVKLEYGEILQNGNFYNDNLRSATAAFTYTASGARDSVRPHFTFYGFRYVKVSGMHVDISNFGDFRAVALYSELAETGNIVTANEKVNRLIQNTRWSQKDNFLDIPTDCPQRDERLGWTGDAEIFCPTASFHMETPTFYRKYMKDMALEQEEKRGAVPYVVPDILTVGREKLGEPPFEETEPGWAEGGASVWGDAATIIPWVTYLHFGNMAWLGEQYTNMKQWTDFVIRMDEDNCGGSRLWTCGFHFGDWLSLDVEGDTTGMDNREGGTDKFYVASVFYMNSARLTAKAATLLGKTDDAAYYNRIADEVRAAVIKKYVCGEGELTIRSQTAYALAICFDLFEGADLKKAGERLMELLVKWNHHLATGFVGTAYLCEALTRVGHSEEAYTLLLNEDYPSWLYEVNMGATTTWERWNSVLPDGSISGTGMNSLNHYAYGCIAQWIYEHVCGIQLKESGVGGQKLVIAPLTDRRLGSAEATVKLAAGKVVSGWNIEGDHTTFHICVPFGSSAQLVLPEGVKVVKVTKDGSDADASVLECELIRGEYQIEAVQE